MSQRCHQPHQSHLSTTITSVQYDTRGTEKSGA